MANIQKSKQIKVISNTLLTKLDILKLNSNCNYLTIKTSKPLDHQSLVPFRKISAYNGHVLPSENDSQSALGDVEPLAKTPKTDEKKNLSKHHLILPNNTQICVETLLSQCVNDEQSDRKFDAKLKARLRKKKPTLLKPTKFLLKNGRLRPIVTPNVRSGVFRSIKFRNILKKKKDLCLAPPNILYSQSTLSSRIQSMTDFANDEWVIERTTKYMKNDWTRPENCDSPKELQSKNFQLGNESKAFTIHNGHETTFTMNSTEKPTIHRLVTPDGFQLTIAPDSTSRFTNPLFRSNLGTNNDNKHLLQKPLDHGREKLEPVVDLSNETPLCRTRFSRAIRSPLQQDVEQIDKVNVSTGHQRCVDAVSSMGTFTEKVISSKTSSDRNRCQTCKKLYLGRRKVINHLKAFPDHDMAIPPKLKKTLETKSRIRPNTPSTSPSNERLFDFLIQKIKNAPIDEKSHILFREISDFVEKLETIRSQLLCDDNTHSSVEYLDKHCSKIFGTQEGNYHISLDILDQLASGMDPNEFASNIPTDVNILPNQLDHNINVSLSSISESKIHLVEGISEESLLKTVDDLMRKEGRMGDGNFDHIEISDNAVEAVTLKDPGTTQPILNLSLDLFKFDGT